MGKHSQRKMLARSKEDRVIHKKMQEFWGQTLMQEWVNYALKFAKVTLRIVDQI